VAQAEISADLNREARAFEEEKWNPRRGKESA
jgi:hypothetical protein